MKKSLLICAAVAMLAASAMAHGPPSELTWSDTNLASADLAQTAPSGTLNASIHHDMALAARSANGGGSGGITQTRSGEASVVAGITKLGPGIAHQSAPVNERMLN